MKIQSIQNSAFFSIYKPQFRSDCQTKTTPLGFDTITFGSSTEQKHISEVAATWPHEVRAVFSDIDGTILHGKRRPTAKNLSAIQKLKDANIPLILVTGRNRREVQEALTKLGIRRPKYLITEQGAIVFKDGNIIPTDTTMNPDDAKKAIKYAEEYMQKDPNVQLFVHIGGQAYTTGKTNWKTYLHDRKTVKKITPAALLQLLEQGKRPTKLFFFKSDSTDKSDMNGIRKFLERKFKSRDDLSIFISGKTFCEVINSSVSKGEAVKLVAKDMEIDLKNTAALGDAGNDREMIKTLSDNGGLSIAMANAMPDLKKLAKATTDDVQNSGWATAIDAMLENNDSLNIPAP